MKSAVISSDEAVTGACTFAKADATCCGTAEAAGEIPLALAADNLDAKRVTLE